jgi:hypothetical protein
MGTLNAMIKQLASLGTILLVVAPMKQSTPEK